VQVLSDRDVWLGMMVIGADGVNSMVRRCSGLEPERERPDRLVSAVVEVKCDSLQIALMLEDCQGRLCYGSYFFTGMTGLAWVFPKGDTLNIGIGSLAGRGKELRGRLGEMLRKLGLEPSLSSNAKWHLIPSRPLRKIFSDRVLLVGDAAGFVNPLTGAGIETGLASAEHAAAVARHALDAGDFSDGVLREYQSRCNWLLRSMNLKARLLGVMDYFVTRRLDSHQADRFVLRHFSRLASV
jgi:digeranylgeranylglycerophospholipid reductase